MKKEVVDMFEYDEKGNYVPARDKLGDPVVDPGIFVQDDQMNLDFTEYPKYLAFGCDDPT